MELKAIEKLCDGIKNTINRIEGRQNASIQKEAKETLFKMIDSIPVIVSDLLEKEKEVKAKRAEEKKEAAERKKKEKDAIAAAKKAKTEAAQKKQDLEKK